MAPPQGACGRGCAPVPNPIWGRGLFERSEFRSPNLSGPGQRHPKGRARAPMVLGPFAETKGSRRVGATPHILPLSPCGGDTPHSSPLGVRGRNPASIPPPSVILVCVHSFVDRKKGDSKRGNSERRASLFLRTACASSSRGFVSGEAVVRRVGVVRDEPPWPPLSGGL